VRAPVRFIDEKDAVAPEPITGRPMAEVVLEMDPGACVVCGREARQHFAGVLDNTYVENGVLRGDATCRECLYEQDDPRLEDLEM
jgi:hypothetical protein